MSFCSRATRSGSARRAAGNRDAHGLELLRLGEAWLDRAQRLERPNHQPRADEQHQRQRHLRHDQRRCARDGAPGSGSTCVRRRAGLRQMPRPGVPQRRDQPEQQPREQRDRQREGERARVERDLVAGAADSRARRQRGRAGRRRRAPGRARRRAAPSSRLSTSSAADDAPRPAPSAARTASSCCRASARTSSRFATFAQAISSTMPIVPISTHSTFADVADDVLLAADAAPARCASVS